MGDPAELLRFVHWAVKNYPARRYALVIWNHGHGWEKSPRPPYRGISYDDSSGKGISTEALGEALGKIAELLAQPLGRYALLLVSAGLLSLCAGLFHWVHLRERHRAAVPSGDPSASDAAEHEEGAEKEAEVERAARPAPSEGAFALVFRHRYLRLLAVFSLVFTAVNTNGEYMLSKMFI